MPSPLAMGPAPDFVQIMLLQFGGFGLGGADNNGDLVRTIIK